MCPYDVVGSVGVVLTLAAVGRGLAQASKVSFLPFDYPHEIPEQAGDEAGSQLPVGIAFRRTTG
jgi:hypothetical protein